MFSKCLAFLTKILLPQAKQKTEVLRRIHISNSPQTGIVLLNMGGPQSLKDVQKYLQNILTDQQIVQFPMMQKYLGSWIARRRAPSLQKKYKQIGGCSPIYEWTKKQGQMLCRQLDKISPYTAPHKYYIAFRYSSPTTEDALLEMEKDRVKRLILFSQYPQYSCATSGSSLNEIYNFYKSRTFPAGVKMHIIDRWGTHPLLVKTFANEIRKELRSLPTEDRKDAIILFSAHSLPLSAVNRGDSYPSEVGATTQLIMQELNNCNPYQLCWQSKIGPISWLGPFTEDAMKGYVAQGKRSFVLVPVAFVNEHIETLHEMDIEYCKDLASQINVANIRRVSAPNDNPLFIDAMTTLVKASIDIGPRVGKKFLNRCPHCTNPLCVTSKQWFAEMCSD